ncbi:MAG TPA: A/G-specific adenine glycosylase [Verrucomicrobiae bacterium]|nr:A/G-specific adenine glycosylase [Verrucomicrobiae bacterium]
MISKPALNALLAPLLAWFAKHARGLPWRGTRDPYAIWISEIMLQQTQVKTVIPYWERWMRALPDIASLAAADPDRVLKLWEGLGYYTRARNLQRAASDIMREHNSVFPRRFEDVLALPGVGRYTAGAICSIAFHEPRPILDGNVIRVLTRVFGIAGDPRERATNEKLWSLAGQLVQAAGPRHCSRLNQSLMELGALICTPRQPRCEACPVRRRCAALNSGTVDQLPNTGTRTLTSQRHVIAFVLQHGDEFFVRRRPRGAVNARLWEFPGVEVRRAEANPLELLQKRFRLRAKALTPLPIVRHSIMHYRITLEAFLLRIGRRDARRIAGGCWLTRAALEQRAFPSAHRKLLSSLDRAPSHNAPLRRPK